MKMNYSREVESTKRIVAQSFMAFTAAKILATSEIHNE
jgi:hypothetical protein